MSDKNLLLFKEIIDQMLTQKPVCADGDMIKKLTAFSGKINEMLEKPICFDDIHSVLYAMVYDIGSTPFKSPSRPFWIGVLVDAFKKWEDEIKKSRITALMMGQSARPVTETDTEWDDIIGMDREKDEMKTQFIYTFIYPKLFPQPARGMLLYGPPGTGKTLLVKALASELKNTILYTPSPSEFKGKYEGETEKKIMAIYEEATQALNAPSKPGRPTPQRAIIFIDEAEGLFGAGRESDPSKQRTVNTFLQVMDGINTDKRISTIAATNFPKTIDEAISRRLPVKIFVNLPSNVMRLHTILDKLTRRYSKFNVGWWDNVEKYGYYEPTKKTTGRGILSRGSNSLELKESYLTRDNLIQVIEKVTHRTSNSSYFESKIPQPIDFDDYKYDLSHIASGSDTSKSPLGYTLADLNNVMNKAFSQASLRATHPDAYFDEYVVKEQGADVTIYIYNPTYTEYMKFTKKK